MASIADAISGKYSLLYPKFLVRADVKITPETLGNARHHTFLLADRKMFGDRNHRFIDKFGQVNTIERGENTLHRTLSIVINE